MSERLFAKSAAGIGLSFIIGAGLGVVVEGRTNEIASGKQNTASTCLNLVPHEGIVTKDLKDCFERGVPGGHKIGDDKFKVGNPIGFVDSYIVAQTREASSIEPARIVGWSASPVLAASAATAWLISIS